MEDLQVKAVIMETDVLAAIRGLADGTISGFREQGDAVNLIGQTFRENAGEVEGILERLTDKEKEELRNILAALEITARGVGIFEDAFEDDIDLISAAIDLSIGDLERHTAATEEETEARIKAIEEVNPALAAEIRTRRRLYARDEFALAVLREVVKIEFNRIKAEQTGWVDSLETDVQRAEGFLDRLAAALSRARLAATGMPSGVPTDVGFGGSTGAPPRLPLTDVGFGGSTGAPPRGSSQPLIVQVGDQVVRELVLDVLNDEVTLTNPSGGIG